MNAWKSRMMTVVLIFFLCGAASAVSSPLPRRLLRRSFRSCRRGDDGIQIRERSCLLAGFAGRIRSETKQAIDERLKQQGIYEVVGESDIRAVLGTQKPAGWGGWPMTAGWSVSRPRLHADYALVSERSFTIHLQFDTRLMNLYSGKRVCRGRLRSVHDAAGDEQKEKNACGRRNYKNSIPPDLSRKPKGDLSEQPSAKKNRGERISSRSKDSPPASKERQPPDQTPRKKDRRPHGHKDKAPASSLQRRPGPLPRSDQQRKCLKGAGTGAQLKSPKRAVPV